MWPTLTQIHSPTPLHSPCVPSTLVFLSRIYPRYPSLQSDTTLKTKCVWVVCVSVLAHCLNTHLNQTNSPYSTSSCALRSCVVLSPSPPKHLPSFPLINHWLRSYDPLVCFPTPWWEPCPETMNVTAATQEYICHKHHGMLDHHWMPFYTQHTEDNGECDISAEHAAWRLSAKKAADELLKLQEQSPG